MLIRTEGNSNPFSEISRIGAFWFCWGSLFGICVLATAQRVIYAVSHDVDQNHINAERTMTSNPLPIALPSRPNTPLLPAPSAL